MSDNFAELKYQWLAVLKSRDLKSKPVGKILLGIPIVLFRDRNKKVFVLLDRCPHRNAPLSKGKIKEDCIVCPYHGWQFTTEGNCYVIPGLTRQFESKIPPVSRYEAIEKNDLIWVRLDNSMDTTIPDVPSYFHDSNYCSFLWSIEANGGLINILENFLDATHTHFVHSGLIRKNSHRQAIKASINATYDRVEICYSGEKNPSGWIPKLFEKKRGDSFGRFIMPTIAEIEYRNIENTSFMITSYISPIMEEKHSIQAVISFRKNWIPSVIAKHILKFFLNIALKQDLKILTLQQNNIQRFGGEKFISTEIDIIRPYIRRIMAGKQKMASKVVNLMI